MPRSRSRSRSRRRRSSSRRREVGAGKDTPKDAKPAGAKPEEVPKPKETNAESDIVNVAIKQLTPKIRDRLMALFSEGLLKENDLDLRSITVFASLNEGLQDRVMTHMENERIYVANARSKSGFLIATCDKAKTGCLDARGLGAIDPWRSALVAMATPKQKILDLEPERDWLDKHGSDPITLHIKVAVCEREVGVSRVSVELPLSETSAALKSKLASMGVQSIQVNKMKLHTDPVGFLKDRYSLAFYNLKDGSELELSARVRAGAKYRKDHAVPLKRPKTQERPNAAVAAKESAAKLPALPGMPPLPSLPGLPALPGLPGGVGGMPAPGSAPALGLGSMPGMCGAMPGLMGTMPGAGAGMAGLGMSPMGKAPTLGFGGLGGMMNARPPLGLSPELLAKVGIPGFGGAPNSVPGLPGMPKMPGFDMASMPKLPGMPGMPGMSMPPSMPPGMPRLPGMPPGLEGMPKAPGSLLGGPAPKMMMKMQGAPMQELGGATAKAGGDLGIATGATAKASMMAAAS